MNHTDMTMFSKLPKDVINICISYTGKLNYRFGKYINKIDPNDERYKMIETIPKSSFFYNEYACRIFINIKEFGLEYTINERTNRIRYCFIHKHKYSKHYTFDANNIWRKTVLYLM